MIAKLIGIRFRSYVSSLGKKSKNGEYKTVSVGRLVLLALVYLYLIGFFGAVSTLYSISLCALTVPAGQDVLFLSLYALLPLAVVFFLSIFETKSVLFESKDTELLLSLPIEPKDIVISRMLTVLLANYGVAAIFMLPALTVYIVFGGSAVGIVGGVLSFLLIPLLATSLSTGVGYLVARLTADAKRKTLLSVVFYLLFFVVLFMFYRFAFSAEYEEDQFGQVSEMLAALVAGAPVLRFIGEAVLLRPLPFLSLLVLTAGISFFVYVRVSSSFISMSTRRGGQTTRKYEKKKLLRRTPVLAVASKEMSKFLSSALYIMNTSMGMLFLLMFTVAVFFIKDATLLPTLELMGLSMSSLYPALAVILTFLTMNNMISSCTVSLEGKQLWIMQMLPVPTWQILLGKALPHFAITSAASLVCGVTVAIRFGVPFVYGVCFVLLPVIANAACALWGVVINTALPKVDFTSEAQAIKQSAAAFIGMFVPMILGMLLIVGTIVMTLFSLGWLAVVFCFALFLLLAAVLYVLMVRVSARRFETIG